MKTELITKQEFNSLINNFKSDATIMGIADSQTVNAVNFFNKLFIELPQVFEYMSLDLDIDDNEFLNHIYMDFTYENRLNNISYFVQFFIEESNIEMHVMFNKINEDLDVSEEEFSDMVKEINSDKFDGFKSITNYLKTIIK